jgi:outer membrane protein OmpA-like peptidoglycan-associated protein
MPSIPKEISKEDVAKKFKSAINITPEKPIRILLFFKSGGSELTQESKEKLPYILESVQKRSPCDVSIIGHTDTVGSEELNIELSLSRANYVLGWIKSHNISLLKTDIKSHGESDLLIKTADNIPEEKNRRVEILIR